MSGPALVFHPLPLPPCPSVDDPDGMEHALLILQVCSWGTYAQEAIPVPEDHWDEMGRDAHEGNVWRAAHEGTCLACEPETVTWWAWLRGGP